VHIKLCQFEGEYCVWGVWGITKGAWEICQNLDCQALTGRAWTATRRHLSPANYLEFCLG